MTVASIESAIAELASLRKVLAKGDAPQVRSAGERSIIKATALSWFNKHRSPAATMVSSALLGPLDTIYKEFLSWCEQGTLRTKYLSRINELKGHLVAARSEIVVSGAVAAAQTASDQPPDFAPLISDPKMQAILTRRWLECVACIQAKIPLAATVMMGGLLEAVLLARVHREPQKGKVFKAKTAPHEPRTKKPKPLSEWALRNYIEVAHELGWITVSAKSVGEVLRDYRNYIHPQKELSHGVTLMPDDASLLWEVSKMVSRQVIKSVP